MQNKAEAITVVGLVNAEGQLRCGKCGHLCGITKRGTGDVQTKCGACHIINQFDLAETPQISAEVVIYLREAERTDYKLAEGLHDMVTTFKDFIDQRGQRRRLVSV